MKHTERNKIFSADDKGNKTYKQSGRKNHNSPLKTILLKAVLMPETIINNVATTILILSINPYRNLWNIINKLKVKQNMKYHHDYYKNSS